MHRVRAGGVAAALVLAASLWSPAVAADPVGCSGAFSGATTCDFTIPNGASGFRLTVTADAGAAAHATGHCCEVLNPLTGEPLEAPLLGQPLTPAAECESEDGGTCETGVTFPLLLPIVQSHTVHCEVGPVDNRPASGTWSCVPSF